MVDRIERLTNLLALLLETREPLSLTQIAGELEGQYPSNEKACRAAFERDKHALREIGVPIETEVVAGGAFAGQTRYRIDRRSYELADLDLDADEMRALQVAVAAVRTDSDHAREAIWKLGGSLGDAYSPVSAVMPERPELPVIRVAVATRSSMSFTYRDQPRTLDPWGLLLGAGFWYVIGYDHARGEQRTFRVDRFDGGAGGIVLGDADSFERPQSFDPRLAFPADPKLIGGPGDEPSDALVRIDVPHAAIIERELGADRVVERDESSILFSVPAGNLEAFRSWVLGLLDHAVVESPEAVREHIIDWLAAVLDADPMAGRKSL